MPEDEGLFLKFNAAREEQGGKAGDEFIHNEKYNAVSGDDGQGGKLAVRRLIP